MRKILEREIIKILKVAGFGSISKQALEILISVYEDRQISILSTVMSRSLLASRPTLSLLDFISIFESKDCFRDNKSNCSAFSDYSSKISNLKGDFSFSKLMNIFNLLNYEPETFEEENPKEDKEWISPISTKVEKAIHIYDFMPNFPSIHTFRNTSVKQQNSKNFSSKVKNRLEQSLRTENNMIKLIKTSGKIPNFVNFIYKHQRD